MLVLISETFAPKECSCLRPPQFTQNIQGKLWLLLSRCLMVRTKLCNRGWWVSVTFVLCVEQGDFVLAGIQSHLIKLRAASLSGSTVNRYMYIATLWPPAKVSIFLLHGYTVHQRYQSFTVQLMHIHRIGRAHV